MQLTPVGDRRGQAVAETLFHGIPKLPIMKTLPTAVFCQPHIGTAGLTEAEARAANRAVMSTSRGSGRQTYSRRAKKQFYEAGRRSRD